MYYFSIDHELVLLVGCTTVTIKDCTASGENVEDLFIYFDVFSIICLFKEWDTILFSGLIG